MTPLDDAVALIKSRGSARTPDIAKALAILPRDVEELLAGPLARGFLVGCNVEVAGEQLIEYRCSVKQGGQMIDFVPGRPPKRGPDPVKARLAEWRPNPSIGQASAGVAQSAPSRPAAPAPVDSPKEKPMQGTIIDRALAALKKHGQLSLDELAKHAGTTKSSLYTYTAELVKKHGVRRVVGKRGTYELGDQQSATSISSRSNEEAKKDTAASPYAGALADLRTKREAMARDLTKLDSAIAAIEALG